MLLISISETTIIKPHKNIYKKQELLSQLQIYTNDDITQLTLIYEKSKILIIFINFFI